MDKDEFDLQLKELDIRLERVRSLYEQYFIGIEKIEPAVARKDLDRRFWALRKVRTRNTALRFRFQTLLQRYNTLQQYWVRICRRIENGTYARHVRRAERLAAVAEPGLSEPGLATVPPPDAPPPRPGPEAYDLGRMLADEMADDQALASAIQDAFSSVERAGDAPSPQVAARAKVQPPNRGGGRAPPPARAAEALSDQRVDALHAELTQSREQLKQGAVSRASVEQKLRQAERQLRSQHPGKRVEFRVEIRDGKAVIKPFLA